MKRNDLLGMLRELYLAPVYLYQRTIARVLPPLCRFEPSCSHYFVDVVRKKGIVIGTCKGAWRIVRCQPFCKGGFDPVE